MQASGLLELIPFICTSAVLGLILFPCSLLAFTVGAGWPLVDEVLEALLHTWRPDIADGHDIAGLLIWQEIFSFHVGNRPSSHVAQW